MRTESPKLFISALLLAVSFWSLEIPKRAFRFYEKGEITKALEALAKSVEKDSLNPAAYFLYAQIYSQPNLEHYDTDKAYDQVNRSIRQFKTIKNPKDLESLTDVMVDSARLEQLKDRIDSLKFEEVKGVHTIENYNAFIARHNDASQVTQAIDLRNSIAFSKASSEHSWQAYKEFMEQYPKAKEYARADSLYRLLIFKERTTDGKLASYKTFLEEFPDTPYLDSIVYEIFRISTATNRLDDYAAFFREYPSEELLAIAYKRMYHTYKQKFGTDDFLDFYPSPLWGDSIRQIQLLEKGYWIPKLTENTIEFLNAQGQSQLKTLYTDIPQRCLCEPITTDFVIGQYNGSGAIIARNGKLLYSGNISDAKDAGYGFIVLYGDEGQTLLHKSGQLIIDQPKEEIAVLNESFIRTQSEGLYGLTSINALSYLPHAYTRIDTLASLILLEKDGRMALVAPEVLHPALDGETPSIEMAYDEVELLENGRIWVSSKGQEAILDERLRVIIPFGNYEIYDEPYGWKLVSSKGIRVLHDRYPQLATQELQQVKESEQWLATKLNNQWALYDQVGDLPPMTNLDSLQLLGQNMALIWQGNKNWAQFKNGKRIALEKGWEPKLLIPQTYIKTGDPAVNDFFMLSNEKKYRKIYNQFGREILSSTFNEVTALGPNLIRLQKRNAALADSTGHYLLNFVYDGIGSNESGYVSLLDKGKFGVINPTRGINIGPKFDKLLEPYSDTVLVATQGRYKGFVNKEGKALTAFEFDEVTYFNDSIALVRIENEWMLENIRNEDLLYEQIESFEIIDVGEEDKTLFITTVNGQGIYSESMGEVIQPTYTFIRLLGTPANPVYFAVKLVKEANIYVVIYYDKKGNKLFTQSFRQEEYYKIACPTN
ncbi:WG repeat-containing protein [Roseivirga thermotolerans]|uniref:WG repeat-containing protein n=2 Tax=Roseivirga TaxID=290180 RepID=A0ABQ3I051_9BACT|nr:WG repeat-containing protein [Roseivirga thermotolerans]GHE52183.1 hypothetical protein GCM10011340_03020 [Roseivirga thermotolerans]